jgi:hypothetical protein
MRNLLDLTAWGDVDDEYFVRQCGDEIVPLPGGFGRWATRPLLEWRHDHEATSFKSGTRSRWKPYLFHRPR